MNHENNHPPESPHRRAWDAIPWVVAGSASDEESRCVHEHLAHCDDCRAEWQLQTQVRDAMHATAPMPVAAPDAAWQQMQARLDAEAAGAHRSADPAHPAQPATPPNWQRWLVAAVLVQAVALGASGLAWLRAGTAEHQTLTSAPAAAATPAMLRLVPSAALDFATLQALLAQAGLVIVDIAPGGLHLGLAPADGNPATALAALPALRAHPGVRLAEPTATLARP